MCDYLIVEFFKAETLEKDPIRKDMIERIGKDIGCMEWRQVSGRCGDRNRAEMFVLLENLKWNFPKLHDIVENLWSPYRDAALVTFRGVAWSQKFD